MRKTGKLFSIFAVIFFSLLCFSVGRAQQVDVSAELSETNIYTGEQVRLKITITGRSVDAIERPEIPEINGLRWLQGSTSQSSSYSFSNGRPSVAYTFGFQFIAQQPGSYRIPEIPVQVDGDIHKTKPISFNILDQADINSGQRSPDIYLRLELTEKSPVVGQQIIADVVLYFKKGIEVSSYQAVPGWKAEGFWKEELDNPQRAQTSSTLINGVRYQRAKLLQYAIFPTKSGALTLSPFEITVAVRQQSNAYDPFGFGLSRERKNLQTLPVKVDVKPLPEIENAQFIGAVGKFRVTREVKPADALVGESIEITTTVSGTGNVPLINKPEYDYPESLELYNPQESSEIYRTNRVISGRQTYTDIVIARNAGTFIIPEEKIAYYNPNAAKYELITLPELAFNIERDPDAIVANQQQLHLNIEPITGLASWVSVASTPLHEQTIVWILLLMPLLLTGLIFSYKIYQDRMHSDSAFARSQKAKENAFATLDEAEKSTEIKEGYHLIEKALFQFISDKLNLPEAGLSSQQLIAEAKQVADQSTIKELKHLLTKCETIAYAPNATQKGLMSDLKKAKELVKTMGKIK